MSQHLLPHVKFSSKLCSSTKAVQEEKLSQIVGAMRESHVQCTNCGPRHDQHMLTSLHTITSCANSTNVSIFECHILMHKSSMVMHFSIRKQK